MTNRDRKRHDMLLRVRRFGAGHRQLFPTTSPAHAAFEVIDAEVDRLDAFDVAERSASLAARAARKTATRLALAECLLRAGATARVLAKTNAAITLDVPVPLPRDAGRILTIARQFLAAAAPWTDAFATHSFTLSELEARIADFQQALHARGMGTDDRVKARAQMRESFTRAFDAVALLDVTVANCLGGDAVTLAVWEQDRRVEWPTSRSTAATADGTEPSEPGGTEGTSTPAVAA